LVSVGIEELDKIELEDLRGHRLDEAALQELGTRSLNLASLRQDITRSLILNDERQIPFDSNFGRQLVTDFGEMFDLAGWKAIVDERLAAIDQRNEMITGVLNRAYQTAARQQSERLQLLFAGSLAATIMALLPALLALGHWDKPAILWVAATVAGLGMIWAVAIILVIRKWQPSVIFASSTETPEG
jgi:hypothetical protein